MRCRGSLSGRHSAVAPSAISREMLDICAAGLRRRAQADSIGTNEEGFIQPLFELVNRGHTRAEELLRHFEGDWKGDMSRLFSEYNFL